jgi:BirA family biotin operon repressor/biotin-[acetyl-CoA-carboxylase] ligase
MKVWQQEGFTINEFDELASTNDKAFELFAAKEISDHFVILANSQNKGRGRDDRSWSSPVGNLYFSILLQNNAKLIAAQISLVAAISMRDAISDLQKNLALKLKWPNDLLLNEKKIAGILLEGKSDSYGSYAVLGIGVNTASSPDNTIFPANNLRNCGIEISPSQLLKKFLTHFEKNYRNWQNFGFAAARRSWLSSAYKFGEKISVRNGTDGAMIEGVFKDLDDDGVLILELLDGFKKIPAAEIFS